MGFARIGSATFETTGILGVSRNASGDTVQRAFPRWATLPSWRDLALGRRWHFFFAWLFVANLLTYFVIGIASGHLRRDLLPSKQQLRPRSLLKDALDHLRQQHADHAQIGQLLEGIIMARLLAMRKFQPKMILTGLTMSPGMDAILPWLVDLFGGRQSARTIHFVAAILIVLFVFVHVAMVFLAGPLNDCAR